MLKLNCCRLLEVKTQSSYRVPSACHSLKTALLHSWDVSSRTSGAKPFNCCFILRTPEQAPQMFPALFQLLEPLFGPTARVTASPHAASGSLTDQMESIKLDDRSSARSDYCLYHKTYIPLRVLLEEAVCFKFITEPLSRCGSTAQLLEDAKCTHTPAPTHYNFQNKTVTKERVT